MQTSEEETVYQGSRGLDFKEMIVGLLRKGKLKSKYIDLLTNDQNMREYDKAFTAASANQDSNYEIYEQIGDLTANKFIVWYTYKRFPQLNCPLGVKVVARIRINYGARQSFAQIGENLGFWPFISASDDDRGRKKKDLLEDCVESFIGVTEYIIDSAFRPGVGYGIVYDILSSIFDDIEISIKYEDLYDPKTRLKELFDAFPNLGTWAYVDTRDDLLATSSIYLVPPNAPKPAKQNNNPNRNWVLLGTGKAAKKADAQQRAAEIGLQALNNKGYVKAVPDEYKTFCKY